MMLQARSCERPSKSSASVFLPSWVSNTYSFSTGTQGSSRRFSAALRPSSPCSASSFASSSRAACHSSWVPTLCSAIALPPSSGSQKCRPARAAELIGRAWTRLAIGLQKQFGKFAGSTGGTSVSATRRDDRAHHQDLQLIGDFLGTPDPGLVGLVFEYVPDHVEVTDRLLVNGVAPVVNLQQRVDEGATIEVRATEPLIERIEHPKQAPPL